MTWSQPTATTAPPPLPVPGTGGLEEIPARAIPRTHPQDTPDRTHRAGDSTHLLGDRPHLLGAGRCAGVRRLAFVALILVVIWALSGGGVFWPIWAIIGWGAIIGAKGSHPAARRSRHGRDR